MTAPLTRIPFTPEEESNMSGAAMWMMAAAAASLLTALINIAKLGVQIYTTMQADVIADEAKIALGGQACGTVLGLVLSLVFSAILFVGARALKKVVDTDENDQVYLVEAANRLRQVFAMKAIVILAVIVLACLLVGVSGAIGAAQAM